jgi:23S rRNA (pseudouridine1915-N3)-methyltransferase
MPFKVAVVGRPRDQSMARMIDEYEKRATRYWPISFQEVRSSTAASAGPVVMRRKEAERLLETVPRGARLVVCDEGGRMMSSTEFAGWLTRERDQGSDLVFLVGGAFGVDDSVKASAAQLLSLSKMTLSHELARLVLAEQLYRAGTIMRGEPYHK